MERETKHNSYLSNSKHNKATNLSLYQIYLRINTFYIIDSTLPQSFKDHQFIIFNYLSDFVRIIVFSYYKRNLRVFSILLLEKKNRLYRVYLEIPQNKIGYS